MKLNTLYYYLLVLTLVVSCNDQEVDNQPSNNESNHYLEILETTAFFEESNFSLDLDNVKEYTFSHNIHTALISSKLRNATGRNSQPESYIAPIFDEHNEFLYALYLVNNSNQSLNIDSAINFSGEVAITLFDEEEAFNQILTIENGIVIDIEQEDAFSSGRIECCGCSVRGVSYCVGDKFENPSGIAEEVTCYLGFSFCLIARYIDCAYQECPIK